MPEDCATESDLDRVLDDLEDYSLNARNYETLQSTLESVNHITTPTAEKLLLLCIRDRIEDLKYAAHVLNIIATLLKKIKDGQCTPLPNLVPSALAVLNVLKTVVLLTCTVAQVNKLETLKTLCFEILISYPDETLVSLCINHSDEIFDIITSCCDHQDIENIPEMSGQPIKLLAKLLRILPPDKKATFVKDGIDIWFSMVIPLLVEQMVTSNTILDLLETLELLTDELVQFDYMQKTSWQKFSENISTPARYPEVMKNLLEKGSPYWHRLWSCFIKLLKNQITMSTPKTGSHINALLPCVEAAFKKDVRNRCRAFLCWNVLIDTFSNDGNEAFLNKGLKLLMVPLTSNNAKVEETALAKFETWWYLITRFQYKIDQNLESVLIPFLTFCFGKPSVTLLIPGMISEKMKVQCVQAFINIVGHSECEGCVALPKLNVMLFNTSLLVNHWKDWFHSISVAIRICVEQNGEFTEKQIKCVWKSFIKTIGELPENNVRRDLYNEALMLFERLTQDCDIRLMSVIVNVLIPTLFDKDEKIQALLKSKNEQNVSVYKIITVLNKLPLDNLEDRKIALESIKTFTNWIMADAFETSGYKIAAKTLSCNSMLFWTALAESMSFYVYSVSPKLLAHMLLWPFKYMNNFVNKEESTAAWLNLYKTIRPYLQIQPINKDIVKALMTHGHSQSSCVFVLSATIAVLEHKLQHEDPDLNEEIELILQLTSKINEVQIKLILPSLASVVGCTLTDLSKNINVTIAEHVMLIINNILKICNVVFQQQFDVGIDLIKYIENIFKSLESTLKLDVYSKLKSHLVDQLKECAPYLKNDKSLNNYILAIYKTSLNKNLADNIAEEVVEAFKIVNSVEQKADPQKITSPSDETAKKSKMGPSITNTVVENGEEYVVVESNWNFKPRRLTENQKEKLQRKRDDIPAMYQDLSQSQDDFKLNTWKTDSQDTSTTSSKSTNATANEDVSVILKNMPNSEIFPKIIENVSPKAVSNVTQDTKPSKETSNVIDKSENNKIQNEVQITVKDVRSPRMALKDRVLSNVRNLIERTNLEQACKNVTVDIFRTPLVTKGKLSTNITNSAPSQSQLERPSRIRKKPKKFDELEVISLKKRRLSLGASGSQADVEMPENQIQEKTDHSKEAKIVTEDKDKAKHVESQVLNKSNDNCTMAKVDMHTLERPGNDESGVKVTVTVDCFVATENLNLTNDVVNRLLEKENETACVDAKTVASSMLTANQTNEKGEQASDPHELNLNNIASSMLTANQTNEKGEQASDPHELNLNNIDKSIHGKIKEKVEKKICTDDTLDKVSCVPKLNKLSKDQKSENFSSISKNKAVFTPKAKKEETNKIESDESKCDVVPTHVDNTKKKITHEKSCPNNTDNRTVSIPNEKIETVKENIEKKICSDDNTDAVSAPKSQEIINKPTLSSKKNTRKSRIESQLAIDMVEGHPLLKVQSEKRATRKAIVNTPAKRKRLSFNADNNKLKRKGTSKAESKTKDKEKSILIKDTANSEDASASQDFIESSQESTVTTISVKSSKPFGNRSPIVILEDAKYTINATKMNTKNLLDAPLTTDLTNVESNSDVELPCNKTNLDSLTEEMDTKPINYTVIVLSEDVDSPHPVISKLMSTQTPDTQNTADADTQPVDPDIFLEKYIKDKPFDADQTTKITVIPDNNKINEESKDIVENNYTNESLMTTREDVTKTISESVLMESEKDVSSSSCNNDQRKKEFLNSTLQISPIKSVSPVRDKKSPSPETSSDYVVIKLVSPVLSNGEPFEICESPEIFTEDKVSPDKRDRSPPREEVCAKNTSPSSSLSLKKNRPQMRSGGRAAQMLGLCVPDRLQTVMTSDKPADTEEVKRSPSINTSARRNLRILYNSSAGESNDTSDDAEDSETFLNFKRTLPATDCSPSGPILKRKLIDITDETTASPASKRKRVSFHDPPVSTTICVKKYLEPIRSPQNSVNKRLERQSRAQAAIKSPRRLENVFKLDSVLTKAVESFSEASDTQTLNEDTEMSSLDETPVVEVVKTSDLNDTDPICEELVTCEDRIANIAAELSSPAMQALLVKTFEGKVETIGDLAKMTELEVNRLCIKAPKVQVVKKVLNEYLSKLKQVSEEITPTVEAAMSESSVLEATTSIEVKTDTISVQSSIQTECLEVSLASSQMDTVETSHSFVQTNETGSKSTAGIITDCISERPDFVESLCEIIDEPIKQKIVENLPYDMLTKIEMDKISNGDGKHVLSILENQLVERFESKDLIRFCSSLLNKVCDKTT